MRRMWSPLSASLRTVVLYVLYVAVRLTWNVRVHGIENDPRAPSTYYAITHKRDFDSMAPLPVLLLQRGWRAVFGEVCFAMRSDSLSPGFLARVMRRPAWLVWLLRPVSLAGIIRALGIFPLQKVTVAPLEEWLRDCRQVAGNAVAAQVLAPSVIEDLAAVSRVDTRTVAARRLSRLFRWRYYRALIRYVGPEALVGAARRATERRVADRARRYIADISDWMRQGGSLYSAPEGQFSPDGHLSRITGGFNRALRDAPPTARVVPITIIYDFMTTGRATMFIDVAPAIEQAPTLLRDAVNRRLRQAWMRAARYTCTQLASGYLARAHLAGRTTFDEADLLATIMRQARELHDQGRAVDERLLRRRGARRRVRRYLQFVARAGYAKRVGRGGWELLAFSLDIHVRAGETAYPTAPLAYAWNELQDMGVPDGEPAVAAGKLTA
jgi:1-acyl-sn-glycerol-3-phosphate acyltransferase